MEAHNVSVDSPIARAPPLIRTGGASKTDEHAFFSVDERLSKGTRFSNA